MWEMMVNGLVLFCSDVEEESEDEMTVDYWFKPCK